MICKWCQAYPNSADQSSALFQGYRNFKLDSLKAHEKNHIHITCAKLFLKDSVCCHSPAMNKLISVLLPESVTETPLGRSLKKSLTPAQRQKLAGLIFFVIRFYFTIITSLQKKKHCGFAKLRERV